jgi:catechol 2,3-dioxygenase-like lactoylglutathione lyase family enzyme
VHNPEALVSQPTSPGLGRIGQIAVNARDLDRATAFYRDRLGLPLLFQVPGMAFFRAGDLTLMLGLPSEPEFDHPASILYFDVADIEAAYGALVERGVTFRSKPHVVHRAGDRTMRRAFFDDSEGNTLALMNWSQAS